jgi:hypothetical protein
MIYTGNVFLVLSHASQRLTINQSDEHIWMNDLEYNYAALFKYMVHEIQNQVCE